MAFNTRKMVAGDVDAVVGIEKACFSSPLVSADFDKFMKDGLGLVSEFDRKVSGYVVAERVLDEAHIVRVAVIPDLRRKGIGSDLISRLILEGKAAGVKKFYLEVRASNAPSRRLYEKAGFSEVRVRKEYYSDNDGCGEGDWQGCS